MGFCSVAVGLVNGAADHQLLVAAAAGRIAHHLVVRLVSRNGVPVVRQVEWLRDSSFRPLAVLLAPGCAHVLEVGADGTDMSVGTCVHMYAHMRWVSFLFAGSMYLFSVAELLPQALFLFAATGESHSATAHYLLPSHVQYTKLGQLGRAVHIPPRQRGMVIGASSMTKNVRLITKMLTWRGRLSVRACGGRL